jgi:hypothetical protein
MSSTAESSFNLEKRRELRLVGRGHPLQSRKTPRPMVSSMVRRPFAAIPMLAKQFGVWLVLMASGLAVVFMAALIAKGLWPREPGGWDGAALEFSLLLAPVAFSFALCFLLLALSMDLEDSEPAKGELTRLLTLKQQGCLPARSRRGRRGRASSRGAQINPRAVEEVSPASALDRLIILKRSGA